MLDLSVVILTYNEELHICRCLENAKQWSTKIFVVDSYSTDKTVEIATELGATVVQHQWPGSQSEQFNWALDHLPINTEWIFRLDADEYASSGLIKEMEERLPGLPTHISAVVLPLGRAFMGRILKHGIVNGVKMIRLFRRGKARYKHSLMDEHLQILSGESITFQNQFIDDSRISIRQFIDKHNSYSSREAAVLLDVEFHLSGEDPLSSSLYCEEVRRKNKQKLKYTRLPLFWRPFGYFVYRYIIKLGILDGKEGFMWDFLQGWWYRTLVDAKIYEIKKECLDDKEKMVMILKERYNIHLN